MKQTILLFSFLIVSSTLMSSCSGSSGSSGSSENLTTYDTISIAFENQPNVEEVQKLIDAVLLQCKMEVNRDNIMHLANGLVVMRKQSKVGVSEMDILKDMYQHGVSNDLLTRLASSAAKLERTK